jgi:tetratricopeptide (TPR) repeat protein
MNQYWSTYRLRDMDAPERGYWDEYTDVMKDSYGIGYDFSGYFTYLNKNSQAALWSFDNALKYRQPQTQARIYMMMGETYLSLENGAAAIPCYQQVLQREPNNPFAMARIGKSYAFLRDYSDAEQAYRASLAVNPQQKEALDGLQELSDVEKKGKK